MAAEATMVGGGDTLVEDHGTARKDENWSEAMQRLLAPSLREKSNALNVARIALAGLDDMISGLKRRRGTVQTEMDSDKLELAAIDKECALLQAKLDRIQSNSKTLQSEADLIEKQLALSKETFSKAVLDCASTIKSTNSNIARLNRSQQHSVYADYLKDGSARAGKVTSKRTEVDQMLRQMMNETLGAGKAESLLSSSPTQAKKPPREPKLSVPAARPNSFAELHKIQGEGK